MIKSPTCPNASTPIKEINEVCNSQNDSGTAHLKFSDEDPLLSQKLNNDQFADMAGLSSEEIDNTKSLRIASRVNQISAMKQIIALLKKVDYIEKLYPSIKALTVSHPKYKDIKFSRNMEAMLLWLNVNKELYHRLYMVADWIDVDPDDLIVWYDWFEYGLGTVFFFSHKLVIYDVYNSLASVYI